MIVKYFNPEAQIAIVKVPRDKYKIIRAAFTLLTNLNYKPVVATIISVNGSARTCKIAALRTLRKWFNESNTTNANNANTNYTITDSKLKKLQIQMDEVCGMN